MERTNMIPIRQKAGFSLIIKTMRIYFLLLSIVIIFTSVPFAQSTDSTVSTDSVKASASKNYFVIETRHRLFPKFLEIDTVKLNQQFLIGEEEYKAEVTVFNPHFIIDDSGKVYQDSDTLYNPAVRVKVIIDSAKTQESWAFFYGGSPHFRRENLLGFRLLDFKVDEKYIKPPEHK